MSKIYYGGLVVTGSGSFPGYVGVEGDRIAVVGKGEPSSEILSRFSEKEDLKGKWILPGVIDDQVHFRDPGLTHKADIETESRAALAGGVTSFMDMPNTNPQTVTVEAWEAKMRRAAEASYANYAFYIGATKENLAELEKADYSHIPGVKVFLGASTGNMLVDDEEALDRIFSLGRLVAIHSEDEETIRRNAAAARERFGDDVPVTEHPNIRSAEACSRSTRRAIERAERLGTRLHILHLSTADEAGMLSSRPLEDKKITGEACVHHLWFTDGDYDRLGALIKWNPAVKTTADRDALRAAVSDGRIDVVATDHAPHLLSEKEGGALKAASGGPFVQFSLPAMLELARKGVFSREKVVELMCENPARLFGVKDRGFLREGAYADLVIVDPDRPFTVTKDVILSKCGWSPIEGETLSHSVVKTILNGAEAYSEGRFAPRSARALEFSQSR